MAIRVSRRSLLILAAFQAMAASQQSGAKPLRSAKGRRINSTHFATLQEAANAAAGGELTIAGTNRIESPVFLDSDTEIRFDTQATIQTSTPDISFFYAQGKANISISGGVFRQLRPGQKPYVAGIRLDNCRSCTVEGNRFEGMQWAGILLDGTTDSKIAGNWIVRSADSIAGDKFDIVLYRSHRNLIANNKCLGGQHGGILVQDPLGSGSNVPSRNRIAGNVVGSAQIAMKAYGIVLYLGGSSPTFHQIVGNRVENVRGDPRTQLATGTGIYCVGSGIGGLTVRDNIVRNACKLTTLTTNGPAGITIADAISIHTRPVVTNNWVLGMSQAHGILLVSSPGGAVVQRNTVHMPSSNNGTGPGGVALRGNGIRVFNSSNALVSDNNVTHDGAGDALLCLATAGSFSHLEFRRNTVRSTVGNAIRVDRTGSNIHSSIVIAGNRLEAGSYGGLIAAAGIYGAEITGNSGSSTRGSPLALTDARLTHISGNTMRSSAVAGVTISGACDGSRYDRTNIVSGKIINKATGITFL